MNHTVHRLLFSLLLPASMLSANPERTILLPGGTSMDLVWIEPGTFTMGLSDDEWAQLVSYNGESDISVMRPPHEVTISGGFWIGKHEVTVGQWESVMHTTVNHQDREPDVAITASSLAIDDFLWRLASEAGAGRFRLPTEAEWEYAGRAGTTTIWSFGGISLYGGRSLYIEFGCRPDGTGWVTCGPQRVAQREPNPWGLHGIHGNVEEMSGDRLRTYRTVSETDPFTSPGLGDSVRVLRGSKDIGRMSPPPPAEELRISAFRREGSHAGFRVVLSEPDSNLRADAGRYRWVPAGQDVRLDGSASVGTGPLSYAWQEHADNPETGILRDADTAAPSFAASRLGEYRFTLRVSDGAAVSQPHEVCVEVVGVSPDGVVTLMITRDVEMDFVWIEAGHGRMGYGDELERLLRDNELWNAAQQTDPTSASRLAQPAHDVHLTQGFYLARHELTQAQWTGLTGSRPWADPPSGCSARDDPSLPAVCISYNQLVGALNELNRASRRIRLQLPTEAQWERAALTGSSHLWSFGSDPAALADHAWFAGNSDDVQPVGLKLPNRWGLHDMDGNVKEWCLDQFGPYDTLEQTNPVGPRMHAWDRQPVLRGGDVQSPPVSSRERFFSAASEGFGHVGARLVAYGPAMGAPVGVPRHELDEVPPTLGLSPDGYPAPGQPLQLVLDDGFSESRARQWSFVENHGEEAIFSPDHWSIVSGTYRLNTVKVRAAIYHRGQDVTNYVFEADVRVTGGEGWILFTHADEQPFWRLSLNADDQTVQLLASQRHDQVALPAAPGNHDNPHSPAAWTKPWDLGRRWHTVRIDVRTDTVHVAVDGVTAFQDVPLEIQPNAVVGLGGIGDREPNLWPVITDKLVYFDDVRLWHGVAEIGVSLPTEDDAFVTSSLGSGPNPFHTAVTISYGFTGSDTASLTIYDVLGQRLWRRSVLGPAGTLQWDGSTDTGVTAATGVYFAVLRADGKQRSHRMMLIR